MLAELNHRVKNVRTVAIAIAQQTLKRAPSPAALVEAFIARLHAMGRSHDLLSLGKWGEVSIENLLDRMLAPYSTSPGRIVLGGPSTLLPPSAAISLGMVLDELATNAVKYGLLSNETGRVEIRWTTRPEEALMDLDLTWKEAGGRIARQDGAAAAPPLLKATAACARLRGHVGETSRSCRMVAGFPRVGDALP